MHDKSRKSSEIPTGPPRLGHVHLKVRVLERSIAFYTRVIGLKVAERIGKAFAFLTSTNDHHTLALQALGEYSRPAAADSVGLYHIAFEQPSIAALEAALERLDSEGVGWSAVDHGISWAIYFDDPDGNGLELYVDRRARADGRADWHGTSRPLSRERIRRGIDDERPRGDATRARPGISIQGRATDRTEIPQLSSVADPSYERRPNDRRRIGSTTPPPVAPAKGTRR